MRPKDASTKGAAYANPAIKVQVKLGADAPPTKRILPTPKGTPYQMFACVDRELLLVPCQDPAH